MSGHDDISEQAAMLDLIDRRELWCEVDDFTGCMATHLGVDGRPYCDVPGHDPDRASR